MRGIKRPLMGGDLSSEVIVNEGSTVNMNKRCSVGRFALLRSSS